MSYKMVCICTIKPEWCVDNSKDCNDHHNGYLSNPPPSGRDKRLP